MKQLPLFLLLLLAAEVFAQSPTQIGGGLGSGWLCWMGDSPGEQESLLPDGVVAHWDAAENVNTTGALVDSWTDKVGGYVASASGGARPVLQASDSNFNNLPTVQFDNTNTQAMLTNLSLGGDHTVIIVSNTKGASATYGFGHNAANPLRVRWGTNGISAGLFRTEYRLNDIVEGAAPYLMPFIGSVSYELTTDGHRIDVTKGGFFFTNEVLRTPVDARTSAVVYIGWIGAGARLYGDIAEIIVYDRALTDSELQTIHTILDSKYSIS